MKIYSNTDVGKERSLNEDAFFAGEITEDDIKVLFVDGMPAGTMLG